MKRFAASTMLAGGLFAGLMGMAGAAHANLGDDIWNYEQQKSVDIYESGDIHKRVDLPRMAEQQKSVDIYESGDIHKRVDLPDAHERCSQGSSRGVFCRM